jgi:hypothetical protein
MRALVAAVLLGSASLGAAQNVVVSPKPDKVAVTVYRDPNGSGEMDLDWLEGFALVSETRTVDVPAGESELRFEGVAGGLLPQSAVVTGLGDSVREKNRDAKLLSPGTLLDASLGQRVTLKRTSKATGKVVEQDAFVRAAANGVVIETKDGVEALRCDGETETLLAQQLPATLAARPTLSTRIVAAQPYRGPVTLTYLSSNFDWRAHYVATLAPDGRTLSLFAWLTLANGDETGFADADTIAVAGRLNREEVERLQPETRSIRLNCWPGQRTHETPSGIPPPPPEPELDYDEAIVVTGSRILRPDLESPSPVTTVEAQRENLGDLKLYRIPIPVTVASNSQKQVAMIRQPAARFRTLYRWRSAFRFASEEPQVAARTLVFTNREQEGLGLPLPAGSFTLYAMREGQPFLVGEGRMTDRAVGEKVEVPISNSPGVRVTQRLVERGDKNFEVELVATNDQPAAVPFEAVFADNGIPTARALKKRDGEWVWSTTIPANGTKVLRFRFRNPD